MAEPEELVLEIARCLELDWQYIERIEAWDTDRIAKVRSAGRKAGRLLNYKIVTVQAERDDEDRVTVVVAVREAPPEERERMHERAQLLMNDFWSKLPPDDEQSQ